jgi:hypothetical protein
MAKKYGYTLNFSSILATFSFFEFLGGGKMAKKVRLYTLKFSSTFSKRGEMAKKYGYTLNFSSIFSHFFSFLEGENGKKSKAIHSYFRPFFNF